MYFSSLIIWLVSIFCFAAFAAPLVGPSGEKRDPCGTASSEFNDIGREAVTRAVARERILEAVSAHLRTAAEIEPSYFTHIAGMTPEEAYNGPFSGFEDFATSLKAHVATLRKNAEGIDDVALKKQSLAHLDRLASGLDKGIEPLRDPASFTPQAYETPVIPRFGVPLPKAAPRIPRKAIDREEFERTRARIQIDLPKFIIDFIAKEHRHPTRKEIAEWAGYLFFKIGATSVYAPGKSLNGAAFFESPEAFRTTWAKAYESEVRRLTDKKAVSTLSPAEETRLDRLLANPPTETGHGLVIPPIERGQGPLRQKPEPEPEPVQEPVPPNPIVEYIAEHGVLPPSNEDQMSYAARTTLKRRWSKARDEEIAALKELDEEHGLTVDEKTRLERLENNPPSPATDGLSLEQSRQGARIRWNDARPQEKAKSLKQIVDFMGTNGRPPTVEEVETLAGHSFSNIVGTSPALFDSPREFKQAWIDAKEQEMTRLASSQTPEDQRKLVNLKRATPFRTIDGIRTGLGQDTWQKLVADRSQAIKEIVKYAATRGKVPTTDAELSTVAGVPADRLKGVGEWSEDGTKKFSTYFDNEQRFVEAWKEEASSQIDLLKQKELKPNGLNRTEVQRLRNLEIAVAL